LTRRHGPPPEVPAEDPGVPSPVREAWERRAAFALLFIAPAFFATNMLTARAMADHVPPVALAFGRWSATLAILLVFVGPTLWRERQVLRAEWRHFLVLGALGMGVCGVSATVAAAPVVQAKSVEIAYTIGTILLWGVGCMFLFPIIGNLLGMSYVQFGAWAGTGILNSAQVAGAALAYQPDGIETLKVAEIFNITRVLVLPIIVLWLAVWYVRREGEATHQVNVGRVIFEKFPLFVLGFILMFALSTTGIFAPANHYKGKYFGNTAESGFKEDKLLKADQISVLQSEAGKIERADRRDALQRLMENKKVMSIADDDTIRGLVNAKVLSKDANKILKGAHKAVRHTAKKIKKFRQWITWLFAFGLVGLGMQITVGSMRQAGGQPAVIGGIVGFIKAVASLVVVMLLISETV